MVQKFKLLKEFEKKDIKLYDKQDSEENTNNMEDTKNISKSNTYQTGKFRNIKSITGRDEKLKNMEAVEKEGMKDEIRLKNIFESDKAYLYLGKFERGNNIIFSARKNDSEENVNTYKNRKIYLKRATAYFRRNYETIAEEIDHAFCYFLSENENLNRFMKYLEDSAKNQETQDISKVFPFLNVKKSIGKLNDLKIEREKIRANYNENDEKINKMMRYLNNDIENTEKSIYYNQLKKAKFKNQIKKVLDSNSELHEDSEEFWLIVELRKLLNYLEKNQEEEIKEEEKL